MRDRFAPYIGGIAALLTSLSYIPQVRKAWPRESTSDLSLGMLATLTAGLALWVLYGASHGDWVIIAAMASARRSQPPSWYARSAIWGVRIVPTDRLAGDPGADLTDLRGHLGGLLMTGVIERNNVHVRGAGDRAMIFAHGFSCDQNMWRFVVRPHSSVQLDVPIIPTAGA
jgi:MtN3 and saliva related transmembrane protein